MALRRRRQRRTSKFAGLTLADSLADRELKRLDRVFDLVDVHPGELIVHANRRVSWVTIVVAGELVSSGSDHARFGEGSIVGLREALSRTYAASDVHARVASVVLQSDLPRFTGAFDEIPGFGRWVLAQALATAPLRPVEHASAQAARGHHLRLVGGGEAREPLHLADALAQSDGHFDGAGQEGEGVLP